MTSPEPENKVRSLDELVNKILQSHALELVEHIVEQLSEELVGLIQHHSKEGMPIEQTIQAVKKTLNSVKVDEMPAESGSVAPVEEQPTDGN